MKRITTLIILTILVISASHSQAQLLLGVRGGYSASGILFTPERDFMPLTDPLIDGGMVLKYFNLERVGFQAEANLTQRGYISAVGTDSIYKRINTYAEVPVYFQIRAEKSNLFGHINLGFYAAVLLNAKSGEGPEGSSISLKPYSLNILRDNYFDFGLRGGVGTGYDFSWGTLQLDIRFNYGFGDLYYYNYANNPTRSPAMFLNGSLSLMINLSRPKKEIINFDDKTITKDINQI